MSDIFISYAREDRESAKALAADLQTRGYRVWWDAELVAADDFQEVILSALGKAGAVVVLWTKSSVKSHFVRDEARYALHYKKLVAVKAPDLDVLEIPFGFQGQHTEDFDNREQIVRGIAKLGIRSAVTRWGAPNESWDSIKNSRDADILLDWLERNPGHEKREEAFAHVRALIDAGKSGRKSEPARIARMSSLTAFLSGLTFRMPRFQLEAQGKWTSIGMSIALVVVMIALLAGGIFGVHLVEGSLKGAGWQLESRSRVSAPLISVAFVLVFLFGERCVSAWARQRNILAATILVPIVAAIAGCAAIALVVSGETLLGGDAYKGPRMFPGGQTGMWATFAAGILVSLLLSYRTIRAVR